MSFPNVPNVPGVPPLPRLPGAALLGPALLVANAFGLFSGFGTSSRWGVYQGGRQVVAADSVVDFAYRQDWVLADFPMEGGAFQSYDKVQQPFDARVRFAAGGSLANRKAFLDSVAAIAGDLNLYDVVTPEQTYSSANVMHYDYRRESRDGVGLVIVDLWLQQVRVTATTAFSRAASANQVAATATTPGLSSHGTLTQQQVADPTAASPVADGSLQVQSVPASTSTNPAGGDWADAHQPVTVTQKAVPASATQLAVPAAPEPVGSAVAATATPAQVESGPLFDAIPRDIDGVPVNPELQESYTRDAAGGVLQTPAGGGTAVLLPPIRAIQ